jgi:hypothetical protein
MLLYLVYKFWTLLCRLTDICSAKSFICRSSVYTLYENLIGMDKKKVDGNAIIEFFPDSRIKFQIRSKKVHWDRKYSPNRRGKRITIRIPIGRV